MVPDTVVWVEWEVPKEPNALPLEASLLDAWAAEAQAMALPLKSGSMVPFVTLPLTSGSMVSLGIGLETSPVGLPAVEEGSWLRFDADAQSSEASSCEVSPPQAFVASNSPAWQTVATFVEW